MAILQTDDERVAERLTIELRLARLGRPSDWEGWIYYELEVRHRGKRLITLNNDRVSILEIDVKTLLKELERGQKREVKFEPLEPDFLLRVYPDDETGDIAVELFVDDGNAGGEGYSCDGVGVRLQVTAAALDRFRDELNAEFQALVAGKEPKA